MNKSEPGMVVHMCSCRYLGGYGRKIARAQRFNIILDSISRYHISNNKNNHDKINESGFSFPDKIEYKGLNLPFHVKWLQDQYNT